VTQTALLCHNIHLAFCWFLKQKQSISCLASITNNLPEYSYKKKKKELNGFQFKFCQRLAALMRVKNGTLAAVEGINFVVWDLRFSFC
jgi:hypothetical protein